VRAESANPKADVIWSIGAGAPRGQHRSSAGVHAEGSGDDRRPVQDHGPWLPYTGILNVFVVNTKKLKPEEYPKTWMDLAQPRFKNLVSYADAEKSGSAYMQLNTFLTIYGDKQPGWDKFKDVFKNMAVSASSGAVRASSTTAKRWWASRSRTTRISTSKAAAGRDHLSEDGTSVIADGMALVKGAPNAAAGKAFIDWALSAATQKMAVQELGRRPIRKDTPPLAALKPLDQIKLVKYDIKNAADKRKEYMDKWNALVQSR
jgi:iron(III) transport system substrate-binding protein